MTHLDLLNQLYRLNMSEVQGLNFLSKHRLISDNVAFAHEIAQPDLDRAIDYLKDF